LNELGIFGNVQGKVSSINKASGTIINFVSTNLKQVREDYKKATAETYGMSKAQIAAHLTSTTLSTGLKILKIAIAATGIGLVVIALGALVTWFSKTQKGIDLLNQVLAGAGAAFDVIIDRVSKFGESLAKFLKGDIKGGIDGITGAFKGMGDEIQRETKLAAKLEKVLQDVTKAEINLDIRRSATNKKLAELKRLSEDTSKNMKDRIQAAQDFAKIEDKLIAEEVSNQEKRVAAMLGFAQVTDEVREKIQKIGEEGVKLEDLGLSESTVEDMSAFRDELTKLYDVQTSSTTGQIENQNKLNSLLNEREKGSQEAYKAQLDRQKEITDNAIKKQQEELDLYIASQGIKAKTLEEEVAIAQKVSNKKLEILEAEYNSGKLSKIAYETEKLNITNEFAEKQANAAVANAERELEAFKNTYQSKIDADKFLNEELFNQEKNRLDRIAEAERNFQSERLAQGVINQLEYNDAINQINAENLAVQAELKNQREADQKAKEALDIENKRAVESENYFAKFDIESERLEQERQRDIDAVDQTGADITAINAKYASLQEEIEREKNRAKASMAADTLGSISQVLGEETKLGKAAALAQALINTYLGITAGVKLGFPAMIPAVAAASATGFAAVKNITKTKTPKAAQGISMDINGPSHSQGGVTLFDGIGNPIVEAQGGEKMVILKREASKELSVLSALNQKHGGVSLGQTVTYANNGGAVSGRSILSGSSKTQLVDYDRIGQAVGSYVSQNINSVQIAVPVDQVSAVANKMARVQQGANL